MGIFKKKGKHSPGNQPKQETATSPVDATQAIGSSSATQAIGNADQTQVLDDAATRTLPSAAATESMSGDPLGTGAAGAAGATGSAGAGVADEDALAGFDRDAAGYPLNAEAASAGSFKAADFAVVPKKKRRRALKAVGLIAALLVIACAGAYFAGGVAFASRFLPGTTVQGIDLSLKTDEEASQLIGGIVEDYQLDVVGKNFSYRTTGPDLGMTADAAAVTSAIHERLNSWRWPLLILEGAHDETNALTVSYDRDAGAAAVTKAVEAFNENAEAPKDASVVFDESFKVFRVEPEQIGTQLDPELVCAAALEAADLLQGKLEITDDQLLQPKRFSTDEKLVESAELATGMISANITLNINGEKADLIDSDTLSQFVSVTKKLKVKFDEEGLAEWVGNLAASYDTVGMSRTYTRADGKEITVSGGTYGWEIDKDSLKDQIMNAIKAGGTSEIEIPCVDTANVYTGAGQRDWGTRYIDVDISEQHVRFYGDDGTIIWESDCITGAPDGKHDTVQGVWYVIMKQSPSKLIGYKADGKTKDYETEVKYWMPFEGNSIGFHDAPWQPSFGGSMYAQGYGSHGCVNLPADKAKQLYKIIEPNDVVVVHS